MAKPFNDENDDKELDPAVERVRRKLVRFVAINLGILLAALMAVLVAVVYKTTEAPVESGAAFEGEIALPAGAKMIGHGFSQDRISVDAVLADGSRAIYLFDARSGRLVGRFAVVAR